MIKPDQRIGATYMCPVYYTFHSEEVNKAERTICQAKVKATLPNSEIISTVINCDACSSKDIAAKHMLHNVRSCAHYDQQPIRLTTVNGVTPWFKEMGILKFKDSKDKDVSILCYAQEEGIPGHPNFVIISNNTLVDMAFDANYQMKASKKWGHVHSNACRTNHTYGRERYSQRRLLSRLY